MTIDVDNRDIVASLMRPQVEAKAEEYASTWTTPPSHAVSAILADTEELMPHPEMAGGLKEARFLQALIFANDAGRVLEIGTFTGATALAIAEALPSDGRLTTIELDEAVASIARRHLDASDHSHKIDLRIGDAREVVETLPGPFDLVFIDAWKQHYIDYFEAVLPKLSERGLIVADNVIWYGLPFHPDAKDAETEGVRQFVRHVQADDRTRNVLLTVGDGLLLIWPTPQRAS
jgi:predicted O-methyltransferase YrrM